MASSNPAASSMAASSERAEGTAMDSRPRPSLLPEDIGLRIDEMRRACPGIDQVWLLRHQSDPPEWDLLAFGDRHTVETLRAEGNWRRPDVRLFVVVDGDRFESVGGEAAVRDKHKGVANRRGRLRDLDWHLEDAETATFLAPEESGREARRVTAVRVR